MRRPLLRSGRLPRLTTNSYRSTSASNTSNLICETRRACRRCCRGCRGRSWWNGRRNIQFFQGLACGTMRRRSLGGNNGHRGVWPRCRLMAPDTQHRVAHRLPLCSTLKQAAVGETVRRPLRPSSTAPEAASAPPRTSTALSPPCNAPTRARKPFLTQVDRACEPQPSDCGR